LVGMGMGLVLPPTSTEAMREVPPALAGAAAGLLNTSRQVGGGVGAAIVGAVLQNQLASAIHDGAALAAHQLPAQLQQPFIDGFAEAVRGGLEVGRGQSGGVQLPAGLPQPAA